MRATAILALGLVATMVGGASARAQGDDFVPYEEPPPAAGSTEVAPPPPAPPAAVPAPNPPPPATAPAPSTSTMPEAVVWAAQFGTACAVPMLAGNLAIIPGLGQILVFVIPALNGFLVQVVGDALSGRKTSPIAPIVGAYIGQFCVMPVCTTAGVATFLGLYLGGALGFIYGTTTTRRFDPLTVGAWVGLGALGLAALGTSLLAGLTVSAVVPVAAYAMFAEDAPVPAPAPATTTRARRGPARAPAAALAVAY